jgi:hypothetical protein
MTQQDFDQMSKLEQFQILRTQSVYLCLRKEGEVSYFLYQVGSFYVQARYDHAQIRITDLESFTDTSRLDPFINRMHVKHLS